jgi:hypothetical protein
MSGYGASPKFCPPHLPVIYDFEADSGKLCMDAFISPKALAIYNRVALNGLNQARVIVSTARHIDPF